ncbi:MAG: hypothetical protein J6X11_00405 [Treponema sp.]|nr:hypothetical protein [Treponema sp.]
MKSFELKTFLLKTLFLKTVLPAAFLTLAVLASLMPLGCKSSVEGLSMLEGDFSCPRAEDFFVTGEDSFLVRFNKSVSCKEAFFWRTETGEETNLVASVQDEGKSLVFTSPVPMQTGAEYTFSGIVQDGAGNTLTITVPFSGYNGRVPRIAISEVHIANSKTAKNKWKAEYAELLVLTDGNLSGLELVCTGSYSSKKEDAGIYKFPPVEVKAGEYITVHLCRNESYSGMNDDEEDNLLLSKSPDSSSLALDLWANNESSVTKTSDALLVQNSADSCILDAVLFVQESSSGKRTEWKTGTKEWLGAIEASGVWQQSDGSSSASEESAFCGSWSKSATTKSICRKNTKSLLDAVRQDKDALLKNNKGCWAVASPTPGYANGI